VAEAIAEHGADARVHGVVVQLPLPKHLDQAELLGAISAEKDVDCLTPLSLGRLAMAGSGEPAGLPSVRLPWPSPLPWPSSLPPPPAAHRLHLLRLPY
jgi:5,10-methylene-tetrahydrofolate dehydrogenase/methenyl tetrahydrofolate cyclohydrolase